MSYMLLEEMYGIPENDYLLAEGYLEELSDLILNEEDNMFKQVRRANGAVFGLATAGKAVASGAGIGLTKMSSDRIKNLKNMDTAKVLYAQYKKKGGKLPFEKWRKRQLTGAKIGKIVGLGTAVGSAAGAATTIAAGAATNKTLKDAEIGYNNIMNNW